MSYRDVQELMAEGVEAVQMIRKGQVRPIPGGTFIDQFNALAA